MATVDVGGVEVDWGALVVVAILTTVLAIGIKLSSRVSIVITAIKVGVVLLVIGVGLTYVKAQNYDPFIPPPSASGGTGSGSGQSLLSLLGGEASSNFGVYGMLAAASPVFFAFIGFDVVATTAEETRNPQRDLPAASSARWPW
jgi:APA family basic amino acid/polyamine antiporter